MREILDSIAKKVVVENKMVVPWRQYKGTENVAIGPESFELKNTTVWSFPKRGTWASHTPQYRGNWPPELVRNLLMLYSKPGDVILDPMVGGGTTPVECKLLERNSISVDINPDAIMITRDRLDLPTSITRGLKSTSHRTFLGDARNLDLIESDSLDLVLTHPPYANMIKYTKTTSGDLSLIDDYGMFFKEYRKAIQEYYRVLKPGKKCAVLMGDTHNKGYCVPLSFRMMFDYLCEGFVLKESIIKNEWNCESNIFPKQYGNGNFMLTMHEHLFILEKPLNERSYPYNSSIDLFMV